LGKGPIIKTIIKMERRAEKPIDKEMEEKTKRI
jgi:hypothetical protein